MVKNRRTIEQIETAKDRAVNFLRNVLHDDERADEVENESLEDYAERKRILIVNPANLDNLREFLFEKLNRIEQIETALFDAVEIIDETDQSRNALSIAMDEVRDVLVSGYGENFDDDFSNRFDNEVFEKAKA